MAAEAEEKTGCRSVVLLHLFPVQIAACLSHCDQAMNHRTDGLVQRRTVANAGASRSPDPNAVASDSDGQAQDTDADSKETRLTLMEEVLLLGLKDKEVSHY